MGNKEKLYNKIVNGPNNVRLKDLIKVMEYFGFDKRESREGVFFSHSELRGAHYLLPNVPKPHGRERKVLKTYVDDCLDAIEMVSILSKSEDGNENEIK